MKSNLPSRHIHSAAIYHWIGSLCRTLLGMTFIFSGAVKAIDPLGTTYKIEDYLFAFSEHAQFMTVFLPLAEVAAWALITFEFVLGVMLLMNVWTKVTSWLSLAMMAVMTPLTLYIALSNPVSDCGCFGDALVLTNWQTFWKNIVLSGLVAGLLLTKRYIPQIFVWQVKMAITCVAVGLVTGFMTYTRLHLPIVDFRPYKIGNNIPQLMEIPEGAPQDVYEVRWLLQHQETGELKEFTLADYPSGDSLWKYVNQESVLVTKGYEPPIHDFTILMYDEGIHPEVVRHADPVQESESDGYDEYEDDDYYDYDISYDYGSGYYGDEVYDDEAFEDDDMYSADDLTYYVLNEEERVVTLAVLYKLEKTNMNQAKRLNEMAKQADEQNMPFLLLTGSGEEEVEKFREESGYTYPIYFCDPVTLKTIVRANPGIVKLEKGTVIDKYNLRNR